ncbi:alanine dehydrogenase [Clostridium sp. YIM B02505]|uniref:Alanine dehydrogenase n=1 Tax=Clostridium yunnanense TaxID=2800325 RepID=A0ABS1EJ78_9CLOT|nr:alanine dehydrogenase [Clostridium yunnanense]MBK1809417.1 alanine dehydrogenase [Clostridium yunnanense]
MIIGLVKEIKNNENRVGLTPSGVSVLVKRGHKVLVEKSAGVGSGFEDDQYVKAGADLIDEKVSVFNKSDLIVKVKEPLEEEYDLFKEGQTLYTYLHLAPNLKLTKALLKKKVIGIGYETVQLKNGRLPLLVPMSEIAGRMSVQIGANLLQKYNGGSGILLGGVPGVMPGEVVIIGGGIVGMNAAKIACGLGAKVTILDINNERLAYLDDIFFGRVTTLTCNEYNVAKAVEKADLLIGAVLVAGASAPKIVTKEMVKSMKKGAVIVDVAIDQGGSIETIDRVTTHDNPCYLKYGVVHYSVANMPGAVPRTSTLALEAATLPYLIELVDNGVRAAMLKDEALLLGLNTYLGSITCEAVAESLKLKYTNPETLLK